MVVEYRIVLDGTSHPVIISDEPEALLAAKAAGRAIIGVEENGKKWDISCAPYVIPGFEDAGRELAELVLRRHLDLPWIIATTRRLIIREFVKEDAGQIPDEEYSAQEAIFRSPGLMAHYIDNQYGFYEYGTWALIEKGSGLLVGMAGVSGPELPEAMNRMLEEMARAETDTVDCAQPGRAGICAVDCAQPGRAGICASDCAQPEPWLELGYHIFRPYRRRGYGTEAVSAVMDYAHEVLGARLCAVIDAKNQASRALAEGLGMKCVMERAARITETDIQSSQGRLLYVESRRSRPDRADP